MPQDAADHSAASAGPAPAVLPADLPCWKPSLSVGNAKLDEQHIVLLEMGRNLLDSLTQLPAARERVLGELEDLLCASLEHDMDEEQILAANGCPTLDSHHLSHTINRRRLQVLLEGARRGDVDAAALQQAVHGWMHHHVGEFDLPVKAYLATPRHTRAPLARHTGRRLPA